MPINTAQAIDCQSEDWQRVLGQLQGNILKGHGREHSALVLISLGTAPGDAARFREFARARMTSAMEQELQAGRNRTCQSASGATGTELFGNLFLSVWGYLKLGYRWPELKEAFTEPDADEAFLNWFLEGMEHTGWALADPPRAEWEAPYFERLDGMLLLACDDSNKLDDALIGARTEVAAFGRVLGEERGNRLYRNGQQIEPFGFVDGISQPNFFQGDPDWEKPSSVLKKDALAGNEDAFGSFLVYRKLEQNVKRFVESEKRLARELHLEEGDVERAPAMMMGRFRDGTPLTESAIPLGCAPPNNQFDFSHDERGARCPHHAHIRKVNPRPSGRNRMARRGMPYGDYGGYDPEARGGEPPETGCGLLFLCFQRDIQVQFGAVQMRWANRDDIPEVGTGQDPVIGQGASLTPQSWPNVWSGPDKVECGIGGLVTLKGGEYFFAPSLAFWL